MRQTPKLIDDITRAEARRVELANKKIDAETAASGGPTYCDDSNDITGLALDPAPWSSGAPTSATTFEEHWTVEQSEHSTEVFDSVATLSNPYTTAQLIEDALAALPAYAPGSCAASRSLSANQKSFSATKLRYTIAVSPTTAVAQWQIKFTPAGGGSPTFTDRSQVGGIVEEIIPAADDPDGTWEIVNVSCHA